MTDDRTTNWDEYYSRPYKTASVTRRFTQRALVRALLRHAGQSPAIIELGGANSCFWQDINAAVRPSSYIAVDNNALGLAKLEERAVQVPSLRAIQADVFNLPPLPPADVVFSVGLIEHFSPERTRAAIEAHFGIARPGGLVVITFPTPTWLYRGTRFASEKLGMWLFHDERPFWYEDVASVFSENGRVIEHHIVWPLVLTQTIVVAKRNLGLAVS